MRILMKTIWLLPVIMLLLTTTQKTAAQTNIIVSTAPLEGLDITPDNMWSFQVQSTETRDIRCEIDGSITYRNYNHFIRYKFQYTIKPGLNTITPGSISPTWEYSSQALRELFTQYKILPGGTYQYCVTIKPNITGSEYGSQKIDDCIYQQSKDPFSITLIDPENNAKIHEYNPMLSWVATYPFVNELTYKIRIAEIKDGQNTENAITRNNPIYSENNLMTNSIVYPVYAKPLQAFQPYAWTVDAYYKGILLGGAQPWKFTIIEDSLNKTLPTESSYIDINIDKGTNRYYAVGNVKIKYTEDDYLQNELTVKILKNGNEIKKAGFVWPVQRGANYYTYDLLDHNLKHNEEIELTIEYKNTKTTQNKQEIKLKYVNPEFVK